MKVMVGHAARVALLALAALWVAACGTTSNHLLSVDYPVRAPVSGGHAERPPAPNGYEHQVVGKPYEVSGRWYTPADQPNYNETGVASWYGPNFDGKRTANGEIYDMNALSAAHKTLPLPSLVEVTNLDNGKSLVVRVNDRGPFVDGRIIDLSKGAAEQLGVIRPGVARVRVRYLGPPPMNGAPVQIARADPASSPAPRRDYAPAPQTEDAAPPREYARVPQPETPAEPPAERLYARADPQPVPAPSWDIDLNRDVSPGAWNTPGWSPPPLPPGQTVDVAYAAPVAASGHYEVQAGVFSQAANAERAASLVSGAGRAEIRPIVRDGRTLYKVVVSGLDDEGAADAARAAVAASGFPDALIVRP